MVSFLDPRSQGSRALLSDTENPDSGLLLTPDPTIYAPDLAMQVPGQILMKEFAEGEAALPSTAS
jgi:hypothetical protein